MSTEAIGLAPAQFINTLFGILPTGFVEVCYLAPEGVKLYPHTVTQYAPLPLTIVDPALPHIMAMNQRGYGCYFGCTVKAREHKPEQRISDKTGKPYTYYPRSNALDSLYITALWADIDEPGESGYQRAIGSIIPPSIVVSSGGGYHAYWLLATPLLITDDNRDMIKRTLKGIAIACGSDTKVADLARIMRLPGTVNTKPGRGAMCEVIDFLPCYYHYIDCELAYAPLAAPKVPQVTRSIPVNSAQPMARWVENYLNTGAREGERNNTAYAAMRWFLDNGYGSFEAEQLVTARAAADGLAQDEISIIVRSALNAPRGTPELPKHMAIRMSSADRRLGGVA